MYPDRVVQIDEPMRQHARPGMPKRSTHRAEVATDEIASIGGTGGIVVVTKHDGDEVQFRCKPDERDAVVGAIEAAMKGEELPGDDAADDGADDELD